jgi:hypothetical protein
VDIARLGGGGERRAHVVATFVNAKPHALTAFVCRVTRSPHPSTSFTIVYPFSLGYHPLHLGYPLSPGPSFLHPNNLNSSDEQVVKTVDSEIDRNIIKEQAAEKKQRQVIN